MTFTGHGTDSLGSCNHGIRVEGGHDRPVDDCLLHQVGAVGRISHDRVSGEVLEQHVVDAGNRTVRSRQLAPVAAADYYTTTLGHDTERLRRRRARKRHGRRRRHAQRPPRSPTCRTARSPCQPNGSLHLHADIGLGRSRLVHLQGLRRRRVLEHGHGLAHGDECGTNDAPVAVTDSYTTPKDTALGSSRHQACSPTTRTPTVTRSPRSGHRRGARHARPGIGRRLHLHADAGLCRRRLVHLSGQRRRRGLQHGDGVAHGQSAGSTTPRSRWRTSYTTHRGHALTSSRHPACSQTTRTPTATRSPQSRSPTRRTARSRWHPTAASPTRRHRATSGRLVHLQGQRRLADSNTVTVSLSVTSGTTDAHPHDHHPRRRLRLCHKHQKHARRGLQQVGHARGRSARCQRCRSGQQDRRSSSAGTMRPRSGSSEAPRVRVPPPVSTATPPKPTAPSARRFGCVLVTDASVAGSVSAHAR